jgi:multidrug efflux pump subunit AcrA (membrane-fusion protein)
MPAPTDPETPAPRRPWIIGSIIIPGDDERPRLHPHWPWYVGGLIVLAFVGYVLFNLFVPRSSVSTDDARISAHYAVIAPRIAGQVLDVKVRDNQMVHKGDVLAVLDDRDARNAQDQAQARLESDLAQVANVEAAIARQPAVIAQSSAQVHQAEARDPRAGQCHAIHQSGPNRIGLSPGPAAGQQRRARARLEGRGGQRLGGSRPAPDRHPARPA